MPRINRIRITNIHYDSSRKILPDVLLETQGDSMLLLLANGGGKTLLLQLVLQVVLPNSLLGNRRICQLLQNERYTGHVLVEWRLDTIEPEYLLTGFCFTNGRDDEPLQYFMYTHYYIKPNDWDIRNLPLLDGEGRTLAYGSLLEKLSGQTGARLQVYEHKLQSYHEELERYHIYRREWERILLTNGSEGGVDHFFRSSKTTLKLLDNLLIPTIADVLYPTNADKCELAEAFHKHRQILLQLPEIKKNLADFTSIRVGSTGLLTAIGDYHTTGCALDESRLHLAVLYADLDHERLQQVAAAENYQDKIQHLEQQLAELSWKLASFTHFRKQQDRDTQARTVTRLQAEAEQAQQGLQEGKVKQAQLEGLHILTGLRRHMELIAELQAKIVAHEKSRPEQQTLLEQGRSELAYVWRQHAEVTTRRLQELQRELTELEERLSENDRQGDVWQQQWNELLQRLTLVENWLAETERLRLEWQQRHDPATAGNPRQALVAWQNEQAAAQTAQLEASKQLMLLDQELKTLAEADKAISVVIVQHKQEHAVAEKELRVHNERSSAIQAKISVLELFRCDLLLAKDEIMAGLARALAQRQAAYTNAIARLHSLQEKLALIADQVALIHNNAIWQQGMMPQVAQTFLFILRVLL